MSTLKRCLVTGSRDWPFDTQVAHELHLVWESFGFPLEFIVVHGDCPTGADRFAHEWAERWGHIPEPHPAHWALLGKAAGPTRNQKMVDLGADICLAFIGPKSKGAKGCAKLAKAAGIETKIIRAEY